MDRYYADKLEYTGTDEGQLSIMDLANASNLKYEEACKMWDNSEEVKLIKKGIEHTIREIEELKQLKKILLISFNKYTRYPKLNTECAERMRAEGVTGEDIVKKTNFLIRKEKEESMVRGNYDTQKKNEQMGLI